LTAAGGERPTATALPRSTAHGSVDGAQQQTRAVSRLQPP